MLGTVSARVGNHLRVAKPSQSSHTHLGLLSLAIPLWVGAMGTSKNCGVNRHIT